MRIFFIFVSDYMSPPNCVLLLNDLTMTGVYMKSISSNLLVARVCVVSILYYKPCQIPLKHI